VGELGARADQGQGTRLAHRDPRRRRRGGVRRLGSRQRGFPSGLPPPGFLAPRGEAPRPRGAATVPWLAKQISEEYSKPQVEVEGFLWRPDVTSNQNYL